jgi:phosphoglycerol transferase
MAMGAESGLRRVLQVLAAYAGAAILCLLILIAALRLWEADLTIPFAYGGDGFMACVWIKSLIEHGWYLHNPSVGLPTGLDMHDYPLAENLHFAVLKLLSFAIADYAAVGNLYYLLTFPLITVSALFVFRRFNVSYGPALTGSLLYAFLPYHFHRSTAHLFLSAYYLTPLIVLIVLRIYLGESILLGRQDTAPVTAGRLRKVLAAMVLCALVASGGIYYAYFACFFLLVAGTCSSLFRKRLQPLVDAGLLITIVIAGVLLNVAPSLWYAHLHGTNDEAVKRVWIGAELYSLKTTQLVLPIPEHRVAGLANLRTKYNDDPSNESSFCSLGLVGSIGFLLLLGRLLYRKPGGPPPRPQDGLSILNICALLLATVGGLGSLLALLGVEWIRAYNRVSVFIAFFALFAVVLLLDKVQRRYVKSDRTRVLWGGLLGLLVVLGVIDQRGRSNVLPFPWLPHAAQDGSWKEEYLSDADFLAAVEASVPSGTNIFQMPYMAFPESFPVCHMPDYSHFRGYLHTRTLHWSYGAMRGRDGDAWQRAVCAQPVGELVNTLAYAGCGGIYLDRSGYPDNGAAVEAELSRALGASPLVSRNQRLAFFNLADYTRALRRQCTDEEWRAKKEAALALR